MLAALVALRDASAAVWALSGWQRVSSSAVWVWAVDLPGQVEARLAARVG